MLAIGLVSPLQESQASTADRARSNALYERAITAFERGHRLDAERLAREALAANPENQQASKLLLLLGFAAGETKAPRVEGDAAALWQLEEGDGSLDSFPDFFHLGPRESTTVHPSIQMGLPFPSNTVQYEVTFRFRPGVSGTVDSGVRLLSGDVPVFKLLSNGRVIRCFAAGTPIWESRVDGKWHTYRVVSRTGKLEVFVDDKLTAFGTSTGIPNQLHCGVEQRRSGKITELFFEWLDHAYQIPDRARA